MTTTLAPPSSPGIPIQTRPVPDAELERLVEGNQTINFFIKGHPHQGNIERADKKYYLYWQSGQFWAMTLLNDGRLRKSDQGYIINEDKIFLLDECPTDLPLDILRGRLY